MARRVENALSADVDMQRGVGHGASRSRAGPCARSDPARNGHSPKPLLTTGISRDVVHDLYGCSGINCVHLVHVFLEGRGEILTGPHFWNAEVPTASETSCRLRRTDNSEIHGQCDRAVPRRGPQGAAEAP